MQDLPRDTGGCCKIKNDWRGQGFCYIIEKNGRERKHCGNGRTRRKSMRRFNITGTCYQDEHYIVNIDRRLEHIAQMVADGIISPSIAGSRINT